MPNYIEYHSHTLLKDYVKCYWFLNSSETPNQKFEILPDGYFDIIISLQNNTVQYAKLVGIWSERKTVVQQNWNVIGVRFKPMALSALLSFEISDLLNTSSSIELSDLGLEEDFINRSLFLSRQALVNYLDASFLYRLRFNYEKIDMRILASFDLIDKTKGLLSTQEISQRIGLSSRQIHRIYSNLIGIGTQKYMQIIKFRNQLKAQNDPDSDFIAYFDQSHFIKNFKKYVGQTPQSVDLRDDVRFIQYRRFDKE